VLTHTWLDSFLWRDLSFLTGPWCILVDFNVVLSADDCTGGDS